MKIHLNNKLKIFTTAMLFCIASLSVNAETAISAQAHDKSVAAIKSAAQKIDQTNAQTTAQTTPQTTTQRTAMKIDDKSFSCIRKMTPVRHFYVDNLLGNIKGTLAVANAPKGSIYPVGSVVQLVPTEVMVKRKAGTFPATGDWEFFELEVNKNGSKIAKRGFVDVKNRFGGNCFACHVPAKKNWDFICESGHGCDPIPINHKMTGALQRSDPRCGEDALESGDRMTLFKLKAMVTIGLTKKWLEETF